MSDRKQWFAVLAIVGGLAVGGFALAKFGPDTNQVETGREFPDYRVVNLATGDTVSLRKQYKDSVTLINIWATWCVPCRTEMPAMEKLYADLKGRGFRIAAVSIDDGSPQLVRDFGRDLGLTFDLLQDRAGLIQETFQTTGVPESFLVNREGVIVKRVIGAHDWSSPVNRALIERLLDEQSS